MRAPSAKVFNFSLCDQYREGSGWLVHDFQLLRFNAGRCRPVIEDEQFECLKEPQFLPVVDRSSCFFPLPFSLFSNPISEITLTGPNVASSFSGGSGRIWDFS